MIISIRMPPCTNVHESVLDLVYFGSPGHCHLEFGQKHVHVQLADGPSMAEPSPAVAVAVSYDSLGIDAVIFQAPGCSTSPS